MLIEIFLAASCSIEAAALGVCECSQDQTEGSFEVCATERITGREDMIRESPATPQPKPLRLCSWYANGTIDSPTLSVITAWVPIGSRLCIGDEVPEATRQVVRKTTRCRMFLVQNHERPLLTGALAVRLRRDCLRAFLWSLQQGSLLATFWAAAQLLGLSR